uniref:Actin maturation protease n=1 Tax=Saccoglossus kowalevskii TaxID=10224 RepID=A0ABM0M664_SACKO|nr:PREDICTED: UPF0692 protein C19orf54 homolog [Saccoglossus kowalevskii]
MNRPEEPAKLILPPPPPPPPPAAPLFCKAVSMVTPSDASIKDTDPKEEIRQSIKRFVKCGLVALCMAANLLNGNNGTDLDVVFRHAQSLGYTCKGEMFSATTMGMLCNEAHQIDCTVKKNGLRDKTMILNHLSAGLPMLVPYDADFNHEPCCKQGQKAHWAVITGFLLGTADPISVGNHHCQQDEIIESLFHLPPKAVLLPSDVKCRQCYLFAKHGKSTHLQTWRYDAMENSNKQLTSLDPKIAKEIDNYLIPEGGIKAGLCNQIILLEQSTGCG